MLHDRAEKRDAVPAHVAFAIQAVSAGLKSRNSNRYSKHLKAYKLCKQKRFASEEVGLHCTGMEEKKLRLLDQI